MPAHPIPPFSDDFSASDEAQDSRNSAQPLSPTGEPRLLDRVRREIRMRHYSIRTERGYLNRIKRFIIFNDRQAPQ
jgi:Phage integrase, N-terminal SAM-like domain